MIAAARSGQLLLAVALTSMTTVPAIAQLAPVAYTSPTGGTDESTQAYLVRICLEKVGVVP